MRQIGWIVLFCPLISCGLLGHKVSEDDCVRWDKKYREVLETGMKKRAKKCDEDSPAAKTFKKKIPENVATSADGMATACRSLQRVGSYTSDDEKCFMKADEPKDWDKCKFGQTSPHGMYVKSSDAMLKSVDSMCGSAEKSDDDDQPKKKKKKKSDDDD